MNKLFLVLGILIFTLLSYEESVVNKTEPTITKPHLKVFLIGGQSNATGVGLISDLPEEYNKVQPTIKSFTSLHCDSSIADKWLFMAPGYGETLQKHGCELSFAAKIAALYPKDSIAIIKCTLGGSVMETQWISPGAGVPTDPDYHLFEYFVNTIDKAVTLLGDDYTYEIAGMVWMQGESDGITIHQANRYKESLTWFIKDLRDSLHAPEMPFVIGKISDISYWPYAKIVRKAQDNVAEAMNNVGTIDANDCPIGSDGMHYTSAGLIKMGNDFAVKLSTIINEKK